MEREVRVLLVENERANSALITALLRAEGMHVEATDIAEEALKLVRHYDLDLVMLSLTLPDMPGSTIISRMRATRCDAPILAFSKVVSTELRLKALAAGADDVVERTINQTELLARMHAIVRRTQGHSQPQIQIGAIILRLEQHEVVADSKVISLTSKEFAILQLLMIRKNTVLSKEAILTHLYGCIDDLEIKIIDVFVRKIRKKVTSAGFADIIGTVWGRGYTVRDRSEHWDTPARPRITQPQQHQDAPLAPLWPLQNQDRQAMSVPPVQASGK